MMNATPSLSPRVRELATAVMEVRFAAVYGEMHEKFWSHLDTSISLAQIIAGTMAVVGAFAPGTYLTAWTGLLLAVLAGLQIGLKPRERSIQFRDTRRRLEALDGRIWSLSLHDADSELHAITSEAPRGFDAFTRPAENKVLRTYGYADQIEPLTRTEVLLTAFA